MTKEQFETEVVALMDMLYRVSGSLLRRRQDQYDAVQSCLLRAWQKRDTLRDESRFRPWLMRILVNECHRQYRENRRLVYADVVEMPGSQPDVPDPSLRDAIMALPMPVRTPFLLYYVEGIPVREVAQTLGIPQGTVKTRLRKGRELIRQTLGEEV